MANPPPSPTPLLLVTLPPDEAVVAGTLLIIVVDPLFEEQAFFRPEGQEKLVPYFASRVLFVGLFTYIFARGCRRSGWVEGLRYGIVIWLFYSIPMTVGFWSFITMPDGGWCENPFSHPLLRESFPATCQDQNPAAVRAR